jgi:hypothetical protein
MIHGPESSHMTDECQVVQEQVYQMKEAWKKHFSSGSGMLSSGTLTTKAKGTG